MIFEKYLELFFRVGTWAATALVCFGVVLSKDILTMSGVLLFILIPVTRVFGLMIGYAKEKDYLMAIISLFVFGVIALSFLYGYLNPSLPVH